MRISRFVLFAAALVLLCGCATYYNPVTERTEYTMYSERDEIDMGVAIDKKIHEDHKVIETPSYIKEMGRKIAQNSDRPDIQYTFRVIEDDAINAFAVPGGFVYLNTGLIEKTDSHDEIACIIGHEISHIVTRDGVNRMQKVMIYSIPAQILFSKTRSAAIQQVVDTTFNLAMLKYSRDDEFRADEMGVTYAYRAGYDPEGMISFFLKLQEIQGTSSAGRLTFLSSHPDIPARIENVRNVIAELTEHHR